MERDERRRMGRGDEWDSHERETNGTTNGTAKETNGTATKREGDEWGDEWDSHETRRLETIRRKTNGTAMKRRLG